MLPLAVVLFAAQAAAQSPTPLPAQPRDARAAPTATAVSARSTPGAPARTQHPDAALLEYLGEFDDAADGLDAMGLEESTQGDGTGNDGKANGGKP